MIATLATLQHWFKDILLEIHVQENIWSFLQMYDHHLKIMSYNIVKKMTKNLPPQTIMWLMITQF
jgi:predicted double-glycine peptidase